MEKELVILLAVGMIFRRGTDSQPLSCFDQSTMREKIRYLQGEQSLQQEKSIQTAEQFKTTIVNLEVLHRVLLNEECTIESVSSPQQQKCIKLKTQNESLTEENSRLLSDVERLGESSPGDRILPTAG